jgi:two-component sensor histidine kinase
MASQEAIFTRDRPIRISEADRADAADFVIAEANHRISNNLAILASAINIRATEVATRDRRLGSEEVALILGEVSAKISTVAWLHRFLSRDPGTISTDLNDHLYRLCETLLSALCDPKRVLLLRTGSGECVVPTDAVVPVSLIVTEVVTNSLKYAHPANVAGTIAVGCRTDAHGALVVEVSDDGVGLPEGFDFLSSGGIGSRTIRVLAKQLGAEAYFESRPIGLWFKLRLPTDL